MINRLGLNLQLTLTIHHVLFLRAQFSSTLSKSVALLDFLCLTFVIQLAL